MLLACAAVPVAADPWIVQTREVPPYRRFTDTAGPHGADAIVNDYRSDARSSVKRPPSSAHVPRTSTPVRLVAYCWRRGRVWQEFCLCVGSASRSTLLTSHWCLTGFMYSWLLPPPVPPLPSIRAERATGRPMIAPARPRSTCAPAKISLVPGAITSERWSPFGTARPMR